MKWVLVSLRTNKKTKGFTFLEENLFMGIINLNLKIYICIIS